MKIAFSQFYIVHIEKGATFPFSCAFQRYLSDEITSLVLPSAKFIAKYGDDWQLIFRISAKHALEENEIRGPTVFKKDKDVEYTVFLPYRVIMNQPHPPQAALNWMFAGAYEVFDRLGLDASQVRLRQHEILEQILSDPAMFEDLKYVKIFGSDAIIERVGYEHLDAEVWKAK